MTKRQLVLVCGALALAACRGTPGTGVCIDAVPSSAGSHHNADEVGVVECSDLTQRPVND